MRALADYSPSGLVSLGMEAFWNAIAEACPEITSGDMAPGETVKFESEAIDVVATWLRNNAPEVECWTIVVKAPRRIGIDSTVTVQAIEDTVTEMLNVIEVHHEDMLERGS